MKILWIYGPSGSGKTILSRDIFKDSKIYKHLTDDNGVSAEETVKDVLKFASSGIIVTQNKPTTKQLESLISKYSIVSVIKCCSIDLNFKNGG